jgi:two-component system, chemotaxis family, CheB/CheR fusion protein
MRNEEALDEVPGPTAAGSHLVVGIGASAGGFEALKSFLEEMPANPGFALVLVQHVGEADGALLTERIARLTRLPVQTVEDGSAVERNRLYVAPPSSIAAIKDGRFRLRPPRTPSERRNPIDRFFQALADACEARAIGIVLSGSGSDGALGLSRISSSGGMTMAQAPSTAAVADMPNSVAAVADHVLAPDELARTLTDYARHWHSVSKGTKLEDRRREVQARLSEICDVLMRRTGHDFKHYKSSTLLRRIERRMQVLGLADVDGYVGHLARDLQEPHTLFRELLIGVTSFFREPEAFAALSERAVATLLTKRSDQVRIWVPGCATGEEAYSIAMLVREQMDRLETPPKVQIFATDVNERALATARRGSYPQGIALQVSPERLARFFAKKGRRYQIAEEIREMCLFSAHNLISDPPFSRLDLISCRNLLIYLGAHLQKKLIPVFHYALRAGGFLFLGASESLTGHNELFRVVDAKHRIAQRKDTPIQAGGRLREFESASLSHGRGAGAPPDADLGAVAQRILLDEFTPRYAIVSEDGQVVFLSEGADIYVQAPSGVFTNNIMRMVRRGLSVSLRTAFNEAIRRRRVIVRDIPAVHTAEGLQAVRLTVQPMPDLGREDGLYMLVFQDRGPAPRRTEEEGAPAPDADAVIESLEQELLRTREDLERTVQDLEAANEELKSSNEELLSMNEELQSANEELETSKEEVQAANQALAAANADLENLLRSTRIATIFLDGNGAIRSFTPAATEIYNLATGDVGRSLNHFTHSLRDPPPLPTLPELEAESRPVDHEIQTEDGRWFLRRVLPYRAAHGETDGVVVTFTDVTQQMKAEDAVRASEERLRLVADALPVLVSYVDADGRYRLNNKAYEEWFGRPRAELTGRHMRDVLGEAAYETLKPHVAAALAGERVHFETLAPYRDGGTRYVEADYLPHRTAGGAVAGFYVLVHDITGRKQAQEALAAARQRAETLAAERAAVLGQLAEGVIVTDPAGRITFVNEAAARLHGVERLDVPPEEYSDTYHLFTEEGAPYPPERLPLARAVLQSETVVDERWRIRRPDGSEVLAIGSASPVQDQDGTPIGAVLTLRDDTARDAAERELRQAERRQSFLLALNDRLRGLLDPVEIMAAASEAIGRHLGATRVGYGEIDAAQEHVVIARDWTDQVRSVAGRWLMDDFGPPLIVALKRGLTIAVDDVVKDPRTCAPETLASFETIEARSTLVTPLIKEGRFAAIFFLHHKEAVGWSEADIVLAEEVAERTWAAVERARVEAALRENAERMRVALLNAPLILYTCDRERRYTWMMNAHPHLPIETVLGKRDDEIAPAAEIADVVAFKEEVMRSGIGGRREIAFTSRGETRFYDLTLEPLRDASGAVVGLTAASLDITESRRAEKRLRESEEMLRVSQEAGRVGSFERDLRTGELRWSSETFAIYGLPQDGTALTSDAWLKAVHPEDRTRVQGEIAEALDRRQPNLTLDFRIVRPDGSVRHIESRSIYFYDAEDRPLRSIGVSIDVTERKRAEKALREREAELARVQEIGRVGGVDVDLRDGFRNKRSPEYLRLHGLPTDAVNEAHEDWIRRLHPEDRERAERTFLDALTSGAREYAGEYRIVRPSDGQVRWISAKGEFERDPQGRPLRLVGAHIDVTELKQAEEALHESEEQLSAIFSQAAAGFAETDLEGRFLRMNDRYCEIVGRLREELVNLRMQDITHPDDLPRNSPLFRRAIETGEPFEIEKRYIGADGSVVWVNNSVTPIRDAGGRPRTILAVSIDITERKAAEERVRESEERFRQLAEALPQIIWTMRPDGSTTYVNRRFRDYHGRDVGPSVEERSAFIHPEDKEAVWAERNAAIAEGRAFDVTVRLKRHDGAYRWHLMWVVPLIYNEVVVSWIGTATDIHDLYEAEAALRQSETQLRLALAAARMGDWSWDAKGDILTVSERAAEIYGISPGPQPSSNVRSIILPEDAERSRVAAEQALTHRKQYDIEYRIRRPSDGASAWVAATGQAIYDAGGQVEGMIGVIQDITARKRDEERQNLLIRELHHRVKNTLATVQAIVGSTARTSASIDEFYKAFVGRIVSMAHTHSLLTEDEWQTASLRDLLADELRPYDESGGRIRLEGPPVELPSELAVPIGMAIHELTTNAAKYGALSQRGGRIEVTWAVDSANGKRRLRLHWTERGGPPVEPPKRQGFGSRLLQRVLTTQLQAEVTVDFAPEGLRLSMSAPLPDAPGFLNPLLT